MTKVLLLGAGSSRDRKIRVNGIPSFDGMDVTTVDMEPTRNPKVCHDLNICPWPFAGFSVYDEIHAYEVLEHLGRQGDVKSFFNTFWECWLALKPGGILAASVPRWDSPWAWGDPSHTRVITEGSLVFLNQEEYKKQVGVTAMSDFRSMWFGDFETTWMNKSEHNLFFTLRAVKPARI